VKTKAENEKIAKKHFDQSYKYWEKERYEEALVECNEAIELAPDWSQAHNLRGVILEEMEKTDESIIEYREAIRLDPDNEDAKENLADADPFDAVVDERNIAKDAAPSRKDTTANDESRTNDLQTQGSDEGRRARIRLAIEDAIWPYAPLNVGVGDLLFVDSDVYYICYCQGVTQSGGVGYVVGGLVGGLSASSLDSSHLQGGKKAAAETRKLFYALSLDERVEQLARSTVIRNPARVIYDDKASSITCTSSTGEKTTFYVPRIASAARAILAEFPEGEDSLYPKEDPYGLLMRASSPKELTANLAQGQVESAALDEIASNGHYMLSFYNRVKQMPREQQDALVANLHRTPSRFRNALSQAIAQTRKKDSQSRKSSVSIGVLLGLIFVGISLGFLSEKNYVVFGLMGLFGMSCLVYMPAKAISEAREQERIAQEVLDALGQAKQT
jgi:hypothetical protein